MNPQDHQHYEQAQQPDQYQPYQQPQQSEQHQAYQQPQQPQQPDQYQPYQQPQHYQQSQQPEHATTGSSEVPHSEPPVYQPYNPQDYVNAPPLPPRTGAAMVNQSDYSQNQSGQLYPPPPPRPGSALSNMSDLDSPIHYTRDPHNIVAYLVPFPKPYLKGIPAEALPPRFLIYTPPPPPLKTPKEGEKEGKVHKVQRKWEEEVRSAKTSTAKTASWQGMKSKATRGISTAMSYTKTSNLEFVNRLAGSGDDAQTDKHAHDGHHEGEETHRTVGLEGLVLVYPSTINSSPEQLRQEFVDNLLRTKNKAQKDAILATGLLPVSFAIDVLFTIVWPFGGLVEIDGVWAAASIKGAKTSRSVTKRLNSTQTGKDEASLKLTFTPSPRLDILEKYLAAKCHEYDSKLFPQSGTRPTETDVLEAIGWAPSQTGGEHKNWEDEQWEMTEVKDDFKMVMTKAAKEWDKWVKAYEKDPENAMKK